MSGGPVSIRNLGAFAIAEPPDHPGRGFPPICRDENLGPRQGRGHSRAEPFNKKFTLLNGSSALMKAACSAVSWAWLGDPLGETELGKYAMAGKEPGHANWTFETKDYRP
jgi:hypothetical protein